MTPASQRVGWGGSGSRSKEHIVDYIGIAGALKKAMSDYTKRDKANYGESDISKIAYPKFIEKLEVCRALLHGFDYSSFMLKSLTDLTRAKLISGGVNFLSDPSKKEDKKFYIKSRFSCVNLFHFVALF